MRDFIRFVESAFGDIIGPRGFTRTEARVDAEAFGNALVNYASDRMQFRVYSDRGDMYVDIRTPTMSPSWEPVHCLMEFYGRAHRIFESEVSFLRDNFDRLADMSEDEYETYRKWLRGRSGRVPGRARRGRLDESRGDGRPTDR